MLTVLRKLIPNPNPKLIQAESESREAMEASLKSRMEAVTDRLTTENTDMKAGVEEQINATKTHCEEQVANFKMEQSEAMGTLEAQLKAET